MLRRFSQSIVTHARTATVALMSLGITLGCNLTKKDETATSSTATTVLPAAPVFTVATPEQPAATAPQALEPQAEHVASAKGRTGTGGATGTHATGVGGATARAGSGGAPATTANRAGSGGTTARTTTAASGTGGRVMVYGGPRSTSTSLNMQCLSNCGTRLQSCVTAAGADPARLTICQQAFTTCQTRCNR